MSSSRTITLFSEQTDASQGTASFLASVIVHGAVIAVISFGLIYQPRIAHPVAAKHYIVRHLDLQTPKEEARQAAGSQIEDPGPRRVALSRAPGGKPLMHPPALRVTARTARGPQTLIQPDLVSHLVLKQQIPVPSVVIWTPVKVPVKTIVAPLPVEPTAANVTPSLQPPNQEIDLSDLELASSDHPSIKLPVLPSTTSPVVVRGPTQVQMAPVTASQDTAPPTPATVVSLSNLMMPAGMATLPPVNEVSVKALPGPMSAGQTKDAASAGKGNLASDAGGIGASHEAGSQASAQAANGASGKRNGAQTGVTHGAANGNGTSPGNQLTADQITLPRDGQFGSVIVGDAVSDEFPEAADVWSGRIAYTVYLHVGLAKSWILQYSLPAAAEAEAAGEVSGLQPPWPYNIVRPNLVPGSIDADALLVHGFVNRSGRFESLAIAFPPDFAQAQFVLNSLQQWQFRPATENGQSARVEVLLIIPSELDTGMLHKPRLLPPGLIRAAGLILRGLAAKGR